ncbi:Gfo/Idh/MocA family protein [Paenibacillus apiarius]|uniref:Gfo/Idh/MocA family oxidoreductase n=1 Tax=Paenibacillus apiarius TaxID=46240 RepID=A0ABT4DZ35_9BACL|nr:Gfo/Idh/MocA family oxidoreductase [Paenibacillus apiarius]MCY9514884.1 Gfo/Idh/MocA family oxidoreductase [Paenibacillus apiarius]MCY9521236.1 Gfo/Idh/MocA family oxidoreductase [Paenibacillus apiarius]MCY9553953.1 Gfo/Idh/MocA family oxidoreductase [Paenibacillus apiarius]MCY9560326.1 Gfo/Idh/MocA family oxidoreductase [Paenibacillus apiarius]MCY9685676.1 Gfo/Idh/MocA family oxidoreductase [Paenibacillus apiarius]
MSPSSYSGLHIGLVGCGNWGRNILRDLKQLGVTASVVACSEASIANAIAYGADNIVASIEAMDTAIDGYVIASITTAHLENIHALLPRRRPIYTEKPAGTKLDEVEKLASEANGLIHVMHKWRYHPGVNALAALAQSEELGKMKGLRLQRTNWGKQHKDVDCALHLLPHDLSIILHMGYLPSVDTAIPNPLGDSHYGFVATLSDLERDIYVTLDVNHISPGNVRSCAVGFENGVAALTGSSAEGITVCRFNADQPPEVRPIPQELPLVKQLQMFLNYLRGGPPPLSSIEEELLIMRRISAVRTQLYGGDS